ncbi:MAG: hypothetical protein MMC23_000651 [Stictis urceolatum]|nr:hypothetical protein [Stictis urceolata]
MAFLLDAKAIADSSVGQPSECLSNLGDATAGTHSKNLDDSSSLKLQRGKLDAEFRSGSPRAWPLRGFRARFSTSGKALPESNEEVELSKNPASPPLDSSFDASTVELTPSSISHQHLGMRTPSQSSQSLSSIPSQHTPFSQVASSGTLSSVDELDSCVCEPGQQENANGSDTTTDVLGTAQYHAEHDTIIQKSQELGLKYCTQIPDELRSIWETRTSPIVQAALSRSDVGGPTSTILVMVLELHRRLKPTIVITCGSKVQRRSIRKEFKKEHWGSLRKELEQAGLKILVVVDERFGFRASLETAMEISEAEHENYLDTTNNYWLNKDRNEGGISLTVSSKDLPLFVPTWINSTPGRDFITLEAARPASPVAGADAAHGIASGSMETRVATIGGIVLVGGHLYGLSTAHLFYDSEATLRSAKRSDHDNDEEDTLSDESDVGDTLSDCDDFWYEEEDVGLSMPSISKEPSDSVTASTQKTRSKLPEQAAIIALGLGNLSISEHGTASLAQTSLCNNSDDTRNADWSLVRLPSDYITPNMSPLDNASSLREIDTTKQICDLRGGQVYAMLPRIGVREGFMGNTSALLTIGEVKLQTRQISFAKPISK